MKADLCLDLKVGVEEWALFISSVGGAIQEMGTWSVSLSREVFVEDGVLIAGEIEFVER